MASEMTTRLVENRGVDCLELTVCVVLCRYWSQVLIPHGTNGFHAMCPFCATPLVGETGYVKLIFQ